MSDSFFSWSESTPSAFNILSGLMPRQAKVHKAPAQGRSSFDGESPLLLLSSELFARLCTHVDVKGICSLQCTCRHLLLEAASNEVWRTVCTTRKIRLADGADESSTNWQHVFACFAQVWQIPRVRGLGWTFSNSEELNRVADSMRRIGARRTKSVAVVRRGLPAPEFWQWWFLAVFRGSKAQGSKAQVKLERGGGTDYASAAGAAAFGHGGNGHSSVGRRGGANGVSGFTRGAVAKAEGRTKPKARRFKITLKTSSGGSVSASTTTTALHSPPALSTRNSPRMGSLVSAISANTLSLALSSCFPLLLPLPPSLAIVVSLAY